MAITTTTARRSAAFLLGASLVVLGTAACGPEGNSVSTDAKQSQAAAPAGGGSAPAAAPASAAKPGDTIALKGTEKSNTADVTLVKVVDNAEGEDEFTKPADGKRFVSVQFRIKATGSAAYSDAPMNSAKLVDSQGQSFGATVADTKAGKGFEVPVNIAPGDTALGFVTFEVPTDAKLDKAQFGLDSGFAQQTGQWKLG